MAVRPIQNRPKQRAYPQVSCPLCGVLLRLNNLRSGEIVCGSCLRSFRAELFELPAEFAAALPVGHGIAVEGEAPCAVHPGNAAASTCARCGNFMCGLCETEFSGKKCCTMCFVRLLEEGDGTLARRRSWNFKSYAVWTALASFLCSVFGGIFLGPFVLAFTALAMRQAGRERPRTKWSVVNVLLLLLGAMETVALVLVVILFAVDAWRKNP